MPLEKTAGPRAAYAAIIVSMLVVFIGDLSTPVGVVVWVLYLIPVMLTTYLWWSMLPLITAAVASVLVVFTHPAVLLGTRGAFSEINRGFGLITLWAVAWIAEHSIRNKLQVRRDRWLQTGQALLSERMSGELTVPELGERVVRFIAEYVGANAGVVFINDDDVFHRFGLYAVPAPDRVPDSFIPGQGLLGQAARDVRITIVRDVPDGYLAIGSALGQAKPRELLIGAFVADNIVKTIIELGFFRRVDPLAVDFLRHVSTSVAVACRSAKYRARVRLLLEQTQRQAEQLQTQTEELRVGNEELEEQSRALKESQARLEQQHAELEQNNAQLEEQTQLLAAQKDDLARIGADLEQRTRDLERASRYKSDFLANMSHELRTPLNSSLILAKLLADNREGNLTAEQVKYAQTILAAGNDLLHLINDVLDLSKVEAGRLDVRPAPLAIGALLQTLRATVEPLATEKRISLEFTVAPGTPDTIETDAQRLEQILRNLLSNAVKFTDRGSVALAVSREGPGRLAFAVRDTGIGIAPENRDLIFEPFRQADGSSARAHGGTGLGLSICRELTRLLGGELALHSEAGKGSTFTVVLPERFAGEAHPIPPARDPGVRSIPAVPAAPVAPAAAPPQRGQPSRVGPRPDDDRERLDAERRTILIVEDDAAFAAIIRDLAHELGFQAVIARTGEEGLRVAAELRPSAVLLDIGLPDTTGLSVLDRLKDNVATRHIPVHVISGSNYTEAAYSMGAVGYMLKPVQRAQLEDAFRRLQERLETKLRRVLVVEDDAVQLDSLCRLLAAPGVEPVGVRSAAECLDQLRGATFDCMVLDLSLPDASGFSLLETLSREEAYSFPPVIVYTGRDLAADEEERLRRYAKSVIIKGAKSPERLLDEVTLFLHQVVSALPPEQQALVRTSRSRDASLEGRRILVVEDDVRNIFALSSILESRGVRLQIARNGREALAALDAVKDRAEPAIDLVLMDVMMPEMDGLTATREIRRRPEWRRLPIIVLTAKATKADQEECHAAGANDYIAKPLDVDRLLSLVRVWMPR